MTCCNAGSAGLGGMHSDTDTSVGWNVALQFLLLAWEAAQAIDFGL